MPVVRLDWFSRFVGNRIEWFTDRGAAITRRDELEAGSEILGKPKITSVTVPRSLSRQVAWLNENLHTDNV